MTIICGGGGSTTAVAITGFLVESTD